MGKNRKMNLRTKLICLFLGLIALPLAGLGTLLLWLQWRNTESFIEDSMKTGIVKFSDQLSQELSTVKSLSNLYYLDDALASALQSETPSPDAMLRLASKYNAVGGHIHPTVTFLTTDGTFYGSATQAGSREAKALLAAVDPTWGNLHWLSGKDLGLSGDYLWAVRPIHNRESGQMLGLLALRVPESELHKVISGYLTDSQNAYLLDPKGEFLSEIRNQSLDYTPDPALCGLYSGSFLADDVAKPQFVAYQYVAATGWTLAISSDLSVLRQPYTASLTVFLVSLVIYFLITVGLAVFFADRFVRPIRQLNTNIAMVQDGNFDLTVPVTSSDEVGQLSQAYNDMLARTKELLDNLMEAQQSRHQAEMTALQAQINPHFIYNTLASIRFLIFANQNAEADRALLALVSILRGTLSNPGEISTVGKELKLLGDYIELQRISFSRTLQVTFDVDESVKSCPMCKLTLQPIAENAFSHGFDAGQVLCSLEIRAKDEGDYVEITITDNGVGYDPNAPKPEVWKDRELHTGLGIDNVNERIRLAFGEEFGLTMESAPGQGTTAHIRTPKPDTKGDAFVYDGSDCR